MNPSDDEPNLDLAAQRVLSDTRKVYSPSEGDAERVRAALRQSLLVAGRLSHSEEAAQSAAAVHVPAPTHGALSKLLVSGAMIATISAGLGYVVGYRAGSASAPRTPASALAATPTSPRPAAPIAAPAAPEPHAATVSPAPAAPAPTATTPQAHAKPSVTAPPPNRSKQAENSTVGDAPPASGSPDVELEALRRVERALRETNARQALSMLDELDRSVPNGQLMEERLAAFVVARCAIGLGSAHVLMQQFTNAYPDSVYAARVAHACRSSDRP